MSNTFLDPVTGLATERVQLTGSNVTDVQTLWTPGMLFNETTSDKPRGNTQGTLLASAARTATATTPNQTNYNARGVHVTLRITAASGTGGLKVVVFAIDELGNLYEVNALPTAILATGYYGYMVYPGASAVGIAGNFNINQFTASPIPRIWGVQVIHGDATSYTYSLGFSNIL